MLNQELLSETLETPNLECWENERTATLTRRGASRSHTESHPSSQTRAFQEAVIRIV